MRRLIPVLLVVAALVTAARAQCPGFIPPSEAPITAHAEVFPDMRPTPTVTAPAFGTTLEYTGPLLSITADETGPAYDLTATDIATTDLVLRPSDWIVDDDGSIHIRGTTVESEGRIAALEAKIADLERRLDAAQWRDTHAVIASADDSTSEAPYLIFRTDNDEPSHTIMTARTDEDSLAGSFEVYDATGTSVLSIDDIPPTLTLNLSIDDYRAICEAATTVRDCGGAR